jgi:hypothetical protein
VEVAGLVLVGHDGFGALAAALGDEAAASAVAVPGRAWDGTREADVEVRATELIPAPYLGAIAADLRRVATA